MNNRIPTVAEMVARRKTIIAQIKALAWSHSVEPAYGKMVEVCELQKELNTLNHQLGIC